MVRGYSTDVPTPKSGPWEGRPRVSWGLFQGTAAHSSVSDTLLSLHYRRLRSRGEVQNGTDLEADRGTCGN